MLRFGCVLLVLSVTAYGVDFVHWSGSYQKAHSKAIRAHKPILMLLIRNGDRLSREIVKDVMTDQPYVDMLNRMTVPLIVQADHVSAYPSEMFYTTRFPTLFLIDWRDEQLLAAPLYGREITPEIIRTQVLPMLQQAEKSIIR